MTCGRDFQTVLPLSLLFSKEISRVGGLPPPLVWPPLLASEALPGISGFQGTQTVSHGVLSTLRFGSGAGALCVAWGEAVHSAGPVHRHREG